MPGRIPNAPNIPSAACCGAPLLVPSAQPLSGKVLSFRFSTPQRLTLQNGHVSGFLCDR